MALTRRSGARLTANIWPGFVDAMTALLLVLMFVLSIFMIVQSILRTTVSTQEDELNDLSGQVATLAEALGLEQQANDQLETEVGRLGGQLQSAQDEAAQQRALIASLSNERDAQAAAIASFEEQVASLLAQNADLTGNVAALEEEKAQEVSAKEALQLALAQARDEIDTSAEEARLAAARREALEALVADLRANVTERETALAAAQDQIAESSEAAKLAAARRAALEALVADLRSTVTVQESALAEAANAAEEASLSAELAASREAALNALVASLRAELGTATQTAAEREARLAETLTLLSATQADLAAAREILDRGEAEALRAELLAAQQDLSEAEAARLIEIASAEALRKRIAEAEGALDQAEAQRLADIAAAEALRKRLEDTTAELSAVEAQQLADAAAAEALRERLANADAELTAMTLTLEEQRQKAEETLLLLAAARRANAELEGQTDRAITERERREALLDRANALLKEERARADDSVKQVELLNQQTAALREQLGALQALLDEAQARDVAAKVQIEALGRNLNTALAQVASEQKARADEQQRIAELEAAERKRLEAEAQDLQRYRSEFFGRVREILGEREGVEIQGDRFVFSSEVLFAPGSAELGAGGRQQISRVAAVLREVGAQIPAEINWILRVDGHTDKVPLGLGSPFADNWELSQARALSVVRYLINAEAIPANRLAATGFGQFQPVNDGDSPEALAANRRIELKFTEK